MFDVQTRSDLAAEGWTPRAITAAVRAGALIRARRDRYLQSDAPRELVRAVRVGGRLGCVSLLALLGVFVFDKPGLHVHMVRGSSRMRSPVSRKKPLPRGTKRGAILHWDVLVATAENGVVGMIDALIAAVRCQSPRYAVATLDSALNHGLISLEQLAEVFAELPRRYQVLRELVDGRAQSGPETLVRLMARMLGCHIELQMHFDGVGYVDLVIDGWLVVECDSKKFHSSWNQQLKDYRRDRVLASLGYSVLRLTAEDIMYQPDAVQESLRGLVRRHRSVVGH